MTHLLFPTLLALACLLLTGCEPKSSTEAGSAPVTSLPLGETFDNYWYNHGAEISRYALTQSRYGAEHPGDAVLIYVTEQLDPDGQVKYEGNQPKKDGAVPVLKLNAARKFVTGVYPYSMMTSTFTMTAAPVSPLKITCSSQEWCGHSFTQFNHRDNGWHTRQHSYFQSEGDQEFTLPEALTEAGVWLTIRIKPADLRTGELTMIPHPVYLRLSHSPIKAYTVTASLKELTETGPNGEAMNAYRLVYPELSRTVEIRFHRKFPHLIEYWSDTYPDRGKPMTTTARRTHSMMLDYWSHNQPLDTVLREKLGLKQP